MSGNEGWRKSCSEAKDRVKVGGGLANVSFGAPGFV
jgi:hypothetical protein